MRFILLYFNNEFDSLAVSVRTETTGNGLQLKKQDDFIEYRRMRRWGSLDRFIYCGKVAITNFKGPELLKLLIAVNGINIQTLVTCVQKHLINDKKFLQENFMEILQIVYHNELFMELLKYSPLLEFLLNRDDLNLNEIEIWNGLIAELDQDISEWNKNYLIIIYSLN
ncbi:hypothetical protein RhiirC2_782621 [Rhizophagus irregularis]|uniref:BACK domain-containing protein n=1 Tax=Rhizophagus irregularis TaxID=588596 RepID=A0A2N1N2M6_9GLOM|nr:hypothetical protein RhiirC2_782621 [Rhizophagus irregularis]